jgi:Holliday junction resolvase RusA-like endonuclease
VIHVYPIIPISAPRQTRADQWKDPPRPPVARYRAYRDELRLRQVTVPSPFHHVVFILPKPSSWSQKQRAAQEGMPHQQKPDKDNLEKALLDAVFGEDSHVWDGRATKLWGEIGLLILSAQPIPITLPFDLSEYYASVRVAHSIGARLAPHTPI